MDHNINQIFVFRLYLILFSFDETVGSYPKVFQPILQKRVLDLSHKTPDIVPLLHKAISLKDALPSSLGSFVNPHGQKENSPLSIRFFRYLFYNYLSILELLFVVELDYYFVLV